MGRVLVTGGAGTIGAAVVRRLIRDPEWEVRVSDQLEAPAWMRESCEIHTGDLRDPDEAADAAAGCTHVIHLAAIVGGIGNFHRYPHTLLEANTALYNAVFHAALEERVERLVHVSSSMVFERATEFPTTEAHIRDTGIPQSAYGFSKLAGEAYCRALHAEHGLPYTICRPFNAYGPGEMPEDEPGLAHAVPDLIKKVLDGQRPVQIFGSGRQTRTLTRVDDPAQALGVAGRDPRSRLEQLVEPRELRDADRAEDVREPVVGAGLRDLEVGLWLDPAMSHPAGENEDFNVSAREELTVEQIARLVWEACGERPEDFLLERLPPFEVDVQRRWPSVEKARELLGFEARIAPREGIAQTVEWLRGQRATAATA